MTRLAELKTHKRTTTLPPRHVNISRATIKLLPPLMICFTSIQSTFFQQPHATTPEQTEANMANNRENRDRTNFFNYQRDQKSAELRKLEGNLNSLRAEKRGLERDRACFERQLNIVTGSIESVHDSIELLEDQIERERNK